MSHNYSIQYVFQPKDGTERKRRAKESYLRSPEMTTLVDKTKTTAKSVLSYQSSTDEWFRDGHKIDLKQKSSKIPRPIRKRTHDFKMHFPCYKAKIEKKMDKIEGAYIKGTHILIESSYSSAVSLSSKSEFSSSSSLSVSKNERAAKRVGIKKALEDCQTVIEYRKGTLAKAGEYEKMDASLETLEAAINIHMTGLNQVSWLWMSAQDEQLLKDIQKVNPKFAQEQLFNRQALENLKTEIGKKRKEYDLNKKFLNQEKEQLIKDIAEEKRLNEEMKALEASLESESASLVLEDSSSESVQDSFLEKITLETDRAAYQQLSEETKKIYRLIFEPIEGQGQFPLIAFMSLVALKGNEPKLEKTAENCYSLTFPEMTGKYVPSSELPIPITLKKIKVYLSDPILLEYVPAKKMWHLISGPKLAIQVGIPLVGDQEATLNAENLGIFLDDGGLKIHYKCKGILKVLQSTVNKACIPENEVRESFGRPDFIVWEKAKKK